MNENIKALLEKVSGDEGLLAKFSACKSVDEAFELAKELVGGFTKEEFVEAMSALNEADSGDISDGDLTAAAGGNEDIRDSNILDPIIESAHQISKLEQKISVDKVSEAVSESISKSATAVSNSISKSAKEVSKSVEKSLSAIGKALAV